MGYTRFCSRSASAPIFGIVSLALIAVWEFYLFATFKDAKDIFDLQGGTVHLWQAIGAALVACTAGFSSLSVPMRDGETTKVHIN